MVGEGQREVQRMPRPQDPLTAAIAGLRWALGLTWVGMIAERLVRAFWPVWSLCAMIAAVLLLGLHDRAPIEIVWSGLVLGGLALLVLAGWGVARFRFPRRDEVVTRLDAVLPGRPLAALADVQAIGAGDDGSEALWRAHRARMAARAAEAKAVEPDLRLARQDRFGLRYIALLGLVIGLLFGSVWRAGSVVEMIPGVGPSVALAQGPSWEGWIEPPAYTGLPSLYLADLPEVIRVPVKSRITLRFYGEMGALSLDETVSGRDVTLTEAQETGQTFVIASDGDLRIDGPSGRAWRIETITDAAPQVQIMTGGLKTTFDGQMSQPFEAKDDYGIAGGRAVFALDLAAVDRRHGLAVDPEPREPLTLDLPLPLAGNRAAFVETLIENLSEHPWAHLPVMLQLRVEDAAGQAGQSAPVAMALPARRFFNPMAAAVIEQRRDLLWSRDNAGRVAQVLRAVSYKPTEGLFRSEAAYLRLRVILRQLEAKTAEHALIDGERDEIAQALWDLGLLLEDGDVGDALERMRAAQERLSEAMKNGATEDEIARLMQELRDATQDYLRQKMQQAQRDNPDGGTQQSAENTMQMTEQDLQDMMDRIQDLMEQGRFAEAQQALQEFQQMMENMQVTQGGAQSGSSAGQQAMEGLADTLRQQQGLSDQAFRNLQEQFNPGAQSGQSQGNEGRSGGDGRGQSHDGQQGQGGGDGGDRPGAEGQQQAEDGQGGEGGALADRQEALRRELERQRQGLPQLGGEAGEAAREALERAGRAMEGAEEALRGDDLAGAIDNQAEAMEALREGMRNMGEALAEQQNPGGQGDAQGPPGRAQADPLGREAGQGRQAGTQDRLLQGEDVYRRARDLLDEIRRRSGEGERPDLELDYLRRLLERF
ncbi:MAG: TIGR02302 family protein [Rhodobacteraceae bacterium CG17_big_fil_post_rev_8_21_14_2_50_63_15]|nr:TIGR02302 family protein [Roseovarius sp.]PIV79551.1 MAG: TIGR02302 family protein [Rhodobacteraceae bacterium CG17_big_fil_post_rev_8_21_14_2_50_63_15]